MSESWTLLLREMRAAVGDGYIADQYASRHGIRSANILTMTDDEDASAVADYLRPRIEGKTVVEIGGGIGLLALHMSKIAKRVFCIEASPLWSFVFALQLMKDKPKNLSFMFGSAEEFRGMIWADVAVFLTHSGIRPMTQAAREFAPVVIDVYAEFIAAKPQLYDREAVDLRPFV